MLQKLTKYGKYVIYGAIALVVGFFVWVFTNNTEKNDVVKDFKLNQKTDASFAPQGKNTVPVFNTMSGDDSDSSDDDGGN